MDKKKPTPRGGVKKKVETSFVRSSAAEYLTLVATGGESEVGVIFRVNGLEPEATVKNYAIVQTEAEDNFRHETVHA